MGVTMTLRSLGIIVLAASAGATFNRDDNCSQQCTGPPMPLNISVPNVLLLSDSIGDTGSGYFLNVKAMVGAGSAVDAGGATGNGYVQHTGAYGKGICGTSFGALACADLWLGAGGWSVIHFNWGLHDICAKMYAPVTSQEYVANMEAIYHKLQAALAPNGTLIWATTTPVPPSYKARNNSDVVRINDLMRSLFGPTGKYPKVVVHDLYSEVVSRCNREPGSEHYPETNDCDVLQSRGVHFSDAGKQFTGIMTAASILPYLSPSPPPSSEARSREEAIFL